MDIRLTKQDCAGGLPICDEALTTFRSMGDVAQRKLMVELKLSLLARMYSAEAGARVVCIDEATWDELCKDLSV